MADTAFAMKAAESSRYNGFDKMLLNGAWRHGGSSQFADDRCKWRDAFVEIERQLEAHKANLTAGYLSKRVTRREELRKLKTKRIMNTVGKGRKENG